MSTPAARTPSRKCKLLSVEEKLCIIDRISDGEKASLERSGGYCPDQIYNADETGLYFKCLLDRTLVSKTEDRTTGYKQYKDRVTILVGTNATGDHKLRPLCIGKFQNPRCMKKVNRDSLPVAYNFSRNAWMYHRFGHFYTGVGYKVGQ